MKTRNTLLAAKIAGVECWRHVLAYSYDQPWVLALIEGRLEICFVSIELFHCRSLIVPSLYLCFQTDTAWRVWATCVLIRKSADTKWSGEKRTKLLQNSNELSCVNECLHDTKPTSWARLFSEIDGVEVRERTLTQSIDMNNAKTLRKRG